jgi:pimeloyl-ACP methyl ester carboxylesterase
MAAFVEALALDKPIVCGYSDGGQVALEMALHHPQLAQGYILIGAAHRWGNDFANWTTDLGMERPGVVNLEHFAQRHPGFVTLLRERQDTYQGPDYWKTYLQLVSTMWLINPTYTEAEIAQLHDPMLILVGDRDGFIPLEHAASLYQLHPRAELAVIPGSDHGLPFNEVELVTHLIMGFARRHQAVPA